MADRHNLVVILSDQQRYDTMACYGNDWIQTPRLNALADESFVFEAPYVTQPVCTPSRVSLLTGLYPHAAGPIMNKMHLDPDIPVIAEMVSEEYHCGYYGKWHLGDDLESQHGFHEWVSSEDGHRTEYTRREYLRRMSDYHRYLVDQGYEPETEVAGEKIFDAFQRAELPEEHQMAAFLGRGAAEFIGRNKDRPFVLYVSTFEPHPPFYGPLNDLYDPDDIPTGPTFLQRPEGGSLVNRARADYNLQFIDTGVTPSPDEYIVAANAAGLGNDVTTESDWLRMRARYMANMTLVDRMVGDITDALERAGIADNTAVVFTSDHGEMIGDHAMLEKRSFYEEASRVPLLIRAPWIGGGDKVPGSISQIDLVPTLLDLLDDDIPVHLQGTSQLGVLKGEETLDDNDVFIQWNGIHPEMEDRHLGSSEINRMLTLPWRSVVSDRWKLNLCAGDQCELFDLRSDPHEMNNLFNDPTHRDRIRDMAARVHTWQVRTGDTAPLPSV